jgi:hypothetical protein
MVKKARPLAAQALRRLRTRSGGGLESTGSDPLDLSDARIHDSLERARERFRMIAERANTGEPLNETQKKVLADAEAALNSLAADGETAAVTKGQRAALEAIIITDGTRPALFVKGDEVDPASPRAGIWQVPIGQQGAQITTVAESVGRINSLIGPAGYAGTGFVVGDGLILTNRHVLEELVGGPDPQPGGTWKFLKDVTIDLRAELGSTTTKSFKVTGVKYAGPDRIKKQIVLTHLDVALLTVETHNGTDPLPPPLTLSNRADHLQAGADLYVMGYPAKPYSEVAKVLMEVFQDEYFVKRFAPGYVDAVPADVAGGLDRVFTHDASTLGGNSGSCVVEFRVEGLAVIGLHFGGLQREENYAHSIAGIEPFLTANGVVVSTS